MERKDQWSNDDDLILAETVLEHIRFDSTQLKAFNEVGERLERTPAACGFRWNSEVRKKYKTEIKEAEIQRLENKKTKPRTASRSSLAVIETPQRLPVPLEQISNLIIKMERTIEQLRKENQVLKQQLNDRPDVVLSEDFKNMLRIIQKARELGLDRIS